MPTVSRHVSASASGSASKRAPTAPGLGLQDSGGDLGGRGESCGFAAALGRRWRAAHNSTGPTTAKRDTHLTRKRSGLHLTNALLWSRVSGPPLLIGSVALAVIWFEGGLKTPVSMLRLAFWPAAVLATIGVGVTAGILGAVVSLIDGVPVTAALLCRCGGSTHRCCRGRGVAAPCGCCTAGTALRAAQGRIRAQ